MSRKLCGRRPGFSPPKLKPKKQFRRDLAELVKPVSSCYKKPCGARFFNLSHVLVTCGRRPHGNRGGGWHRERMQEEYENVNAMRKRYYKTFRRAALD